MSLRYQSSQATSVSRATVFGRCRDVSELEPLCGDRPFRKSANTQCFGVGISQNRGLQLIGTFFFTDQVSLWNFGCPEILRARESYREKDPKGINKSENHQAKKHGHTVHTEYMISYNTKAGMD